MARPLNDSLWHQLTEEITQACASGAFSIPKRPCARLKPNSMRGSHSRVRACSKTWHSSTAASWQDAPHLHALPAQSAARRWMNVAAIPARSSPTAVSSSPSNAAMVSARPVGAGFFPLDDELGLLPGQLTPCLQEGLVRLSTHIPSFAKAAVEFAFWTQSS